MSDTLRKKRYYPVPPAVVWEAITSPAALAEWLMPNSFKAELGADFEFVTDPTPVCGAGIVKCRVLELDPPRRMVWSWKRDAGKGVDAAPSMTVSFALTPHQSGTLLVLEQTGLQQQGLLVRLLLNIGWGMMLRRSLRRVIGNIRDTANGPRFAPGAIPLRKRYYRCKTVPKAMLHGTDA
jgi:uncharacterized protein YndB with AHSA1/START domain